MAVSTIVLMIVGLVFVYLQVSVTWLVVKLEPEHKKIALQIAVVWFMPVVGAFFIAYMKSEEYPAKSSSDFPIAIIPLFWVINPGFMHFKKTGRRKYSSTKNTDIGPGV